MSMKKHLIILLAILSGFLHAQDQLFKKDNSKILVKVTEISTDEVKYKLFENLGGPTYILQKSEVALIIYEGGRHEVMEDGNVTLRKPSNARAKTTDNGPRSTLGMSREDSSLYYNHSNSLSLNFLSFFNMEVGLMYQKDFLKNNMNITIPFAIGIDAPFTTQEVYFGNINYQNGSTTRLNRKLFEVGFGVNYYPSLRFPVNYYIGPAIRYIQYDITQSYSYRDPSTPQNVYQFVKIDKKGIVSRYCVSITNGFIFRTKSRLTFNIFGSLGFKNDVSSTKIIDPNTNLEINAVRNAVGIYAWLGLNLGFSF
jgi:hypothetical protein